MPRSHRRVVHHTSLFVQSFITEVALKSPKKIIIRALSIVNSNIFLFANYQNGIVTAMVLETCFKTTEIGAKLIKKEM